MPNKIINSDRGIKIEDGGVYCQGPVTSTTATACHLNGNTMHGVLVAGHLKGFYKKNRFGGKWVRARCENNLKV